MDKQAHAHEIILRLKQIFEGSDLTYQDVIDLVEANGDTTSMTTVRRLFADGSENAKFSWRSTIQPIAKALFAIAEPEKVSDIGDNILQAQMDGLKQVCQFKESVIKEKDAYILELEEKYENERLKVQHLLKEVDLMQRMFTEFLEGRK